jgi:transposase-like protein
MARRGRPPKRPADPRAALLAPVRRWTPKRKAALCRALSAGTITLAEAKTAHGLSDDELKAWIAAFVQSSKAPPLESHT